MILVLATTRTEVAGFLSVASKGAALALVGRIVLVLSGFGAPAGTPPVEWSRVVQFLAPALAILAAVTATFGNFAAYWQTNLKRLLAYSTIAHAGYMLMGLAPLTSEGAGAVLFYLVAYLFMNLGAFAVVAFLRNLTGSEELEDFRGMIQRAPVLVITLGIFLLSLLGIPPLAGFLSRLLLVTSVADAGYGWLAIVASAATLLTIIAAVRFIGLLYSDAGDEVPFTLGATPVVIISERLAKQVFAVEDPIGRRIKPGISSGKSGEPMRVVVGVVGDVKSEGLGVPSIPESYVPYAQLPFAPMSVVVRTEIAPGNMVPTLTGEVQSLDSALPLLHVKTLDEYVDDSIVGTRFETFLLGTFGVLAFVLTAVGLYGVISYTVVQRTREMGIRLALGADRAAILGMVVKNGALLACAGALIGLAAAFLLTRLMASLLFGVGPRDPLTFLCVPIALIAVAIVASYIPARRAAKVYPMVALRYE